MIDGEQQRNAGRNMFKITTNAIGYPPHFVNNDSHDFSFLILYILHIPPEDGP
jgi:hypothetical protein